MAVKLTKSQKERLANDIEVLTSVAAIEGTSANTIFNNNTAYEFNNCTICFKSKTITAHVDSVDFSTPEGNKHYYALMGLAANFNFEFIG